MSGRSGSWGLCLRMARRDITRSKGRSALIAAMVGTPVLLTVMLVTLIATHDVSAREDLPATLGTAQARATLQGGRVEQFPDLEFASGGLAHAPAGTERRLADATDARIVPIDSGDGTILVGGRRYAVEVTSLDLRQPVARSVVRLESGRMPRADDEVLVTPAVADRGVRIGADLSIDANGTRRVVGTATYGSVAVDPTVEGIVALPDAVLLESMATDYLVDRAAPVTWAQVKQLNAAGFLVLSRDVIEHPPATSELYPGMSLGSGSGAAERALLTLTVTMIVIEVALLAGPAFAVGARRKRRELALVAAAGGRPADVRRVVLAQAVVLGVASSVAAAALGLAVSAAVARVAPLVRAVAFGPFETTWSWVVASVLVGSVAALAAAYVPARQAARLDVAAVLAGRRGTVSVKKGWPVVGVLLIGVGLAVCFTRGIQPGGETAVAFAAVAIVLGAVLLTPLLIGAVARVGGVLPLPFRLAIRDTARQRSRSAPAVGAVMAVVAGLTALAIASASDFEQSRRTYTYSYPDGTSILGTSASNAPAVLAAAERASGHTFTPLRTAGTYDDERSVDVGVGTGAVTEDQGTAVASVAVADPATLQAWGVRLTSAQRAALANGRTLVGLPSALAGRSDVRLTVSTFDPASDQADDRHLTVPAVGADLGLGAVPRGGEPRLADAVVSAATAKRLDLPTSSAASVMDRSAATPSKDRERSIKDAVSAVDPQRAAFFVERGFQETFTLQLVLLVGLGGAAVLIGTLTATGLALSDARPDFATLAAVGASPRTRRWAAGAQAIVLGLMGALLGIAVGFAPGIAATWPLTSQQYVGGGYASGGGPTISIPWGPLALIALAVPALAAVAAMACTRSRLPMVRRLGQ